MTERCWPALGVFDALDTWALERPDGPDDLVASTLTLFLARLWNTAQVDRAG